MSTKGETRFTRSANACESCRRRKVKCSGSHPCTTCARQGLECRFGNTARRGYSESYVQNLLSTIKDQRRKLQDHDSESVASAEHSSHAGAQSPSRNSETTAKKPSPQEVPLTPVTDLAPGPAFESRVRSILRGHTDSGTSPQDASTPTEPTSFEPSYSDPRSTAEWRGSDELVSPMIPSPVLLSKDESYRLFDVFNSLMGVNQHYLDPRAFSDSIILLYQSDATRMSQMQTMWYTQYLLVMAMGMLIGSPSRGDDDKPPGNAYFAEAMRRLPPLHQLGSQGVICVEILCLITLYLQWCDRKHDAYLYIGTAVRLAIALGCSLPQDEQPGLPSEICHRIRVWWTAYMLDRRLSAGLGLPTGADDRQLRADLPKASAGFQPPLPLIINIQIAKVTGEIMTSFYGNSAISQIDLVRRIQSTLQTLHETGRTIPSNLSIDFSDTRLNVARTSASLYLMLFQAIILCIRPILLQCVKEKVEASKRDGPQTPISPVLTRLCKSCQEAAVKTIRILSSLRNQRSIALFGYFDLDATFSAAFVLLMMGFIKSSDPQKPPEGLAEAAEILQYLTAAGNKAAQRRLADLKQFCYHVWSVNKLSDDWRWLRSPSSSTGDIHDITHLPQAAAADVTTTPSRIVEQSLGASGELPLYDSTTSFWPEAWEGWVDGQTAVSTENSAAMEMLDFDMDAAFQMDLSRDAGDIYSSFNDPNLPLTGVDEVDWAEMGKMFRSKGS